MSNFLAQDLYKYCRLVLFIKIAGLFSIYIRRAELAKCKTLPICASGSNDRHEDVNIGLACDSMSLEANLYSLECCAWCL